MSDRALSLVGTGSNPDGRPDTDFYATPEWATLALLEREKFGMAVLEPACGDGAISKVLATQGHIVGSYDLYDHGFGNTGIDFLQTTWSYLTWDAVITNPPYRLAEEFLTYSLELVKPVQGKVALLLKLQFLEGQKRKSLLESSPLKNVYVFSKRLTFTRNNQPVGNSGMMAFAWYVWDYNPRYYCNKPHIDWI
jgi:hypothetical protein